MLSHRPQWILFDAAGTLLRADPDVTSVYQQMGCQHGFSLSQQEIRQGLAHAWAEHFRDRTTSEEQERRCWRNVVCDVFATDDRRGEPLFEALWQHFALSHHWRLFDDVALTWNWLAKNGFQLGIASNFDQRLFQILAGLAPLDQAARVFASTHIGHRKPSRSFFRHIESELGLAAHRLLLVGDNRTADYEGALAAGWQALHVDRSLAIDSRPMIQSLTSIIELLA